VYKRKVDMKSTLVVFIGMIAAAVSLVGCGDDHTVEIVHLSSVDADVPRDQSCPENVVENLAVAYRLQDFELYQRQLDPSFMVKFSSPIGDMTGMTYEQDLLSTRQMFEGCSSIEFEMAYEKPVPSTLLEYPPDRGFWQVKIHSLRLRVTRKGSEQTFVVSDNKSIVVLKDVSLTGVPDWRMVMQQLYGSGDKPKDEDT